jgi:hypothetical protein
MRLIAAMVLFGLASVAALAHHLSPIYDTSKKTSIKGNITNLELRNPHSWISMDARDASGKVVSWTIEMASTTTLAKSGLDKSLIDLNQTYWLEVFPSKDGTPMALGITLTFPDSTSFDLRDKPAQIPR